MKSIRTIIGDRATVTVERTMHVRDAARLMAETTWLLLQEQ